MEKDPNVELRFVTLALKRFWWILVLCLLLGVVAATQLSGSGVPEYRATALILVQPSDDSISPAQANLPDRFVASQISLLESNQITEQVATALGGDETPTTVSRSLEFSQRDQSDVVEVIATTSDPVRSQQIAQTTAEIYLAELERRVEALFAPEQNDLIEEIASLDAALLEVNERLAAAAEPFLDQLDDETPVPVPSIEILDPVAATERSTLLDERATARTRLNALAVVAADRVNSELIQGAEIPDEPIGDQLGVLRVALVVFFGLLGIAGAMIASRFSRIVTDERDIEAELHRAIEARVPRTKLLSGALGDTLELGDANPDVLELVEQLTSRVELATNRGDARIVGVGGTELRSGSSTLATVLAGRFAIRGYDTVLVDADSVDSRITRELGAPPLLHESDYSKSSIEDLGETALENLMTLGIDPEMRGQRIDASAFSGGLRRRYEVIVVDLGPLLLSPSASQLMDQLDAIVLSVPKRRQSIAGLQQLSRTYGNVAQRLLPVVVDVPRRSKAASSDDAVATPRASSGRARPQAVDAA